MTVKEFTRSLVPPIAVDVMRWLIKGSASPRTPSGPVRLKYGDFILECDASHNLPRILAALPDYGRNLADLVLALNMPEPVVIDVGANIGDTALLLARFAPGAKMLCIEGDSRFVPVLKSNTSQVAGVTIVRAVLSDRTTQVRGRFEEHDGTAHLIVEDAGDTLQTETLDALLAGYPDFACPHVIKIDTDGFDAPIMRGAKRVLALARPVVFYEWDPYSYRIAGENDFSHADFLMELGFNRFLIFNNRGDLLLHVRRPGREVWESLAHFSRTRRHLDGWYYDVAAFPDERQAACESLWQHCSRAGGN